MKYKIYLILIFLYSCAAKKVVNPDEQSFYDKVKNATQSCKINDAIKLLENSSRENLSFFDDTSDESSYFGAYPIKKAIALMKDISVNPYIHCNQHQLTSVENAKERYNCIRKVSTPRNLRSQLLEKYGKKGYLPFFRFGGLDINNCKAKIIRESENDIDRVQQKMRQMRHEKIKKLKKENPVFAKCSAENELRRIENEIKTLEKQIIYTSTYGTSQLREQLPLFRQKRDYDYRLLKRKKNEFKQWKSVNSDEIVCKQWRQYY